MSARWRLFLFRLTPVWALGVALALVTLALLATLALERSRLGAQLVAVRENEAAAQALGVDVLAVKLRAITLSAAMTGAAGGLSFRKRHDFSLDKKCDA